MNQAQVTAARMANYAAVSNQARIEEAGGLAKPRAVLLLWYLRNVVGVDVLDAYDYVCDGDADHGVDALFLTPETGADEFERLTIYQSKYTQAASQIGENDVKHLIATANHFRTLEGLEALLSTTIEPRLAGLINEFDLVRKLREGWVDAGRLQIDLVLVSTGFMGPGALAEMEAANRAEGRDFITAWDIDRIGPIAAAVASRDLLPDTVTVDVPSGDVLVLGTPGTQVGIAAIRADQIVTWPGIVDRSLFDLNVRHELGPNRVRRQLQGAIGRPPDHPDFLAYHNGLTVVCNSFLVTPPNTLEINGISVVNGAQSVIAFHRDSAQLTGDLRVFVKLVEVATRPVLAREVSRRSNTQNPVNPRMLMANSGPQLRLTEEFAAEFPDIDYITRPDATLTAAAAGGGRRVIANDDAAQLLCAIFDAMPWLAVKRTALFETDSHALIFKPSTTAAHVVLADEIAQAVERGREAFPNLYVESWKLTTIVAAYLVGQVLREGEKAGFHRILAEPNAAITDPTALRERLDEAVAFAAFTLTRRHEALGAADDYKKNFKNEAVLKALGREAQDYFSLQTTMPRVAGAPSTS